VRKLRSILAEGRPAASISGRSARATGLTQWTRRDRRSLYPPDLVVALRPYRIHLFLLAYTPFVLTLDGRLGSIWLQDGLGLLTFLVLWLVTCRLPADQRRQVWLCVLVATGFEVLGSQVWGVYRYRLGNIPLYVPPGHGLVYWFGLTADDLPVFRRHGRRAALAILGSCATYVLLGLTLLPIFTHRLDVQGALCFPVLAWCIVRTPRYALFAAIFVATLDLELSGTLAGDWHWLAVAPWDHVPSGNPPSAIAGGYCIIDGTVAVLAVLLDRARGHSRSGCPQLAVHPQQRGERA
jgi:hypothetical protein